MNKYQEALDTLTDWFHSYTDANGLVHEKHIDEDYQKAKETLQELIKWYEAFEQIAPDYTKKMIEIYINKKG